MAAMGSVSLAKPAASAPAPGSNTVCRLNTAITGEANEPPFSAPEPRLTFRHYYISSIIDTNSLLRKQKKGLWSQVCDKKYGLTT
ncbi:hypothetical protein [Cohnella caldifontis]|uniref:hypothetical protein n=1 Tax=Cohnella caldifontis TaxID=3027471 RepID=UPI0023EB5DA8|nr:hypothetical protein [Cohnella sp. YIM B05605]